MEIAARSLKLFARSFDDYPTRVTSASLEELEAGAANWMEKLDRMIPDQREREFRAVMLSPYPPSSSTSRSSSTNGNRPLVPSWWAVTGQAPLVGRPWTGEPNILM